MSAKKQLWRSIGYWALALVAFKIAIFLFAYLGVKAQGRVPDLCAWDCAYYKTIATTGYYYDPVNHGPLAFFPLYPKLVGLVQKFLSFFQVSADFAWTGISINLFLFGTATFLLMLWSHRLGFKHWWLPALLWTLDRHTIWAQIPYTETLFCNLLLIFLILAEKPLSKASQALAIAAVGAVASANRIVGVSLVGALGLGNFAFFLRRPFLGLLTLALGLGGMIAFFSYVHLSFGSWSMSLETTDHWGRHFELLGLWSSSVKLLRSLYFPTVLTLSLCIWWLIKPPAPFRFSGAQRWVHALLIFIPMANSVPISLTRYLSVLMIAYLAWAWVISTHYRRWWCWILILSVIPEIYWQTQLLMKFMRAEVFFWVA